MKILPDASRRNGDYFTRAFTREIPHADEPFGFQDANNFPQMLITGGKQRRPLVPREFVRRSIAPAPFTKREWAIIHHHVLLEKFFSRAKAFRKQSPQALAANFAARAIESQHRPFRMFVRRMVNSGLNAEPIAHGSNLAERDTGLRHTKRTGIHSEKQHALADISVAP